MKATILVCDKCTEPRKHAVTTISLTNGRNAPVKKDLCEVHDLELRRFFGVQRAPRINDDEVAPVILDFIKKHGPCTPKEMYALVHKTGLYRVLGELVKTKKLIKSGTHRSARYKLA